MLKMTKDGGKAFSTQTGEVYKVETVNIGASDR